MGHSQSRSGQAARSAPPQQYPTTPQAQAPHQGVQYLPPPVATAAAASLAPPRLAPPTQEFQTTATIRNQVNLKKHSLAVAVLPSNPAVLTLSFAFDAIAACRVTTFLCAREEVKARCKIVAPQEPSPAVLYPIGLDQHFPAAGSNTSHHIDTGAYTSSDLTEYTAGADTFPLIIRMEALTDEGRADGRSLSDLAPGSEAPKWVQSQTTYARLVKEDDGTWGVRVLKQKIWANGTSYDLQEIYGMERNPTVRCSGAESGGMEEVEGNECVICMSAARDTTALPCRHMCMCYACASALKTQTNKCPICRNEIDSLLHIKIHKNTAAKLAAAAAEGPKGPTSSSQAIDIVAGIPEPQAPGASPSLLGQVETSKASAAAAAAEADIEAPAPK